MEKNKKKLDKLVTKFVENFLHKTETLLSDQDAQLGNRIVLKRLAKCKSRLAKACCPRRSTPGVGGDGETEEYEMLFHFDNDCDYTDDGKEDVIPMIDENTAPALPQRLNLGKEVFLSNMLSHMYNMQTLVDNTLTRNLKEALTPTSMRTKKSSSTDDHVHLKEIRECNVDGDDLESGGLV